MSIRTIKLPYTTSELTEIKKYVENYNSILRFTYNRLYNAEFKLSTAEVTILQKNMNNVILDSHFLNSAQREARQLKDRDKVIFGGKYNFLQRCKGRISREEFLSTRIQPLYSVGEASQRGNRKFRIKSENEIVFQPSRNHHFNLILPKLRKNYKKILSKLKTLQDARELAITYKLDLNYIYIIFDNDAIQKDWKNLIKDRIFAVDLNPNYIGWSVVDWIDPENYKVIDAGVVSNKILNDKEKNLHEDSSSNSKKYITQKRKFENIDTVKFLVNHAAHYGCSIFSLEKLEVETKDHKQGKKYNRLVNNQWDRTTFYEQIKKRCDIFGMHYQEVVASYSSFEGNLVYRETGLPDMCLSSIELGRRAYEFYHQYVIKDRPVMKNIMFDMSKKCRARIRQSLEELKYFDNFTDIKSLYNQIKVLNLKYRTPLESSSLQAVHSKKSIKSNVLLYSYL